MNRSDKVYKRAVQSAMQELNILQATIEFENFYNESYRIKICCRSCCGTGRVFNKRDIQTCPACEGLKYTYEHPFRN